MNNSKDTINHAQFHSLLTCKIMSSQYIVNCVIHHLYLSLTNCIKSTNCEIGSDNGRQTTFKTVGKGKKKWKKREAIMIASMLIWCGGMNIDDARNRQ